VSNEITGTTTERLRALSVSYRDAKETFEAHRDRWHEAIVDAVDGGMTPAQVGGIVGVTPQRIQAIIARIYAQAD
jgi:hypothetical protein